MASIILAHYAIKDVEQTSYGCPDQYEGHLLDGSRFLFHYRHGWVSLTTWADDYEGAETKQEVGQALGDSLSGVFDSFEERDEAFADLYRQLHRARMFPANR